MSKANPNRTIVLTLAIAALLLLAIGKARASTVTAHKTGEAITGTTKQCYYAFGGSQYTITIKAYELCPLSIEVDI